MSFPPNSRRLPYTLQSMPILPEELISEVLSFLPVKSLIQLKCVCKSWNTLISHPSFIQTHLKRSLQNPNLALFRKSTVLPISVHRLLSNPSNSITLTDDPYYQLKDKDCSWLIGSCNGLLCLFGKSKDRNMWLRFWNPATRIISEKLGYYHDFDKFLPFCRENENLPSTMKLAFGYDNSRDMYKVVALSLEIIDSDCMRTIVRVFSLGDNVWRDIQNFPMIPLHFPQLNENCGTYFSNSINWLVLRNNLLCNYYDDWDELTSDEFAIVSLDLGKETYTMLLPPRDFDEAPFVEPTLCVLMDCLCLSHYLEETHLIIWQMKDFGVEKSWIQFLKISNENLQNINRRLVYVDSLRPLCLSKNGDTLILESDEENGVILCNLRDNRVESARIIKTSRFVLAKDYIESLVSYC